MELIIFDDSPSPYPFDEINDDDRILYIHDNTKHFKIWEKRNILNEKAKGDIIVCMDDDDFQSNHRVQHSVDTLIRSNALLCGYNGLFIYDSNNKNVYEIQHKRKNHVLNNCFAFKKQLLTKTKYKETKGNFGEEEHFTKNFTENVELLDKFKTILVVNHSTNTVSKSFLCKQNCQIQTSIVSKHTMIYH